MKTYILSMFLIFVCSVSTTSHTIEREKYTDEILSVEDRIFIALDTIPLPMKRLILAQAKHESGNFTNNLTRKYNNVMAVTGCDCRKTLAIARNGRAEGKGIFNVYSSIDSAMVDFMLHMQYMNVPDTFTRADTYAKFLKKQRYYGDTELNYRRALQRWLNQIPE